MLIPVTHTHSSSTSSTHWYVSHILIILNKHHHQVFSGLCSSYPEKTCSLLSFQSTGVPLMFPCLCPALMISIIIYFYQKQWENYTYYCFLFTLKNLAKSSVILSSFSLKHPLIVTKGHPFYQKEKRLKPQNYKILE